MQNMLYQFNHGKTGDISRRPGRGSCTALRIKKNEREIEQVMENTMKVLELLEELEDIVDEATGLPLTGKIMLDAEEIFQIVREIRLALPDDVQQAKWIRDERTEYWPKQKQNMSA